MKAFVQHRSTNSDKMVMHALIPFMEINAHALFTQKSSNSQPSKDTNYYDVEENACYYQRVLDKTRIKEIKTYIYNSILDEKENLSICTLFPTALVLAYVSDEEINISNEGIADTKLPLRFYIVDGQHRLMAMRRLYEELSSIDNPRGDDLYVLNYLLNYKFSCTLLLNFDLWEQSQVFIDINFKQKPVSKSLYYDVFGAEYKDGLKDREQNKIYIAHKIIEKMNNMEGSPFYQQIKMLGRGKGYISQSFFVEAIIPFFKDEGIWYFNPVTGDNKNGSVINRCASELLSFYSAIATVFIKYWGLDSQNKPHLLCKTTGVGAMVRIIPIIRLNLPDFENYTFDETSASVTPSYCNAVMQILQSLKDEQPRLFGEDSLFRKTGGKGLENSLYNQIIKILIDKGAIDELTVRKPKAIVKTKRSDLTIRTQLSERGIDDITEPLCQFMNNNLPSEIDALGNNCRVEDISDVSVNAGWSETGSDNYIISGSCKCNVEINLDHDDTKPYYMVFPAEFTAHLEKSGKSWKVADSSTIVVDTDEYYR